MGKRALSWTFIVLTLFLAGCDHVTKVAALHTLASGDRLPVVSGVLELRYAENHDTAFSLLRNIAIPQKALVLTVLSGIALIALGVRWWKRRQSASLWEQVGYSAILAGALGNVVERAYRGFVIDFIHLQYWPTFNVADILIVLGFGLLLLASFTDHSSASRSAAT